MKLQKVQMQNDGKTMTSNSSSTLANGSIKYHNQLLNNNRHIQNYYIIKLKLKSHVLKSQVSPLYQ